MWLRITEGIAECSELATGKRWLEDGRLPIESCWAHLCQQCHNIGQLVKQHGAKKEVQEPLLECSQGSVRKHSCAITASRFTFTNLSRNAQQS